MIEQTPMLMGLPGQWTPRKASNIRPGDILRTAAGDDFPVIVMNVRPVTSDDGEDSWFCLPAFFDPDDIPSIGVMRLGVADSMEVFVPDVTPPRHSYTHGYVILSPDVDGVLMSVMSGTGEPIGLETLQGHVGGYIQLVPVIGPEPGMFVVVNDYARLKAVASTHNPLASSLTGMKIFGTAVIVESRDGDLCGIPLDNVERFVQQFDTSRQGGS
jgi:hypothetical protein